MLVYAVKTASKYHCYYLRFSEKFVFHVKKEIYDMTKND